MFSGVTRRVFDHVVIGGGITGAATAFHLRKLQPLSRILLVDREEALGCGQTAHSAGVVVHEHKSALTSQLAAETTCDVEELLPRRRDGAGQFPNRGSWKPRHGTFDPRDYFVDVNGLVQDYVGAAQQDEGLEIWTDTEVVGMEGATGDVLALRAGIQSFVEAQAKQIYNCTGMESQSLLAALLPRTIPSNGCVMGFANLRSHYWELYVNGSSHMEKIRAARAESQLQGLSLIYLPGMYLKLSQHDRKIEVGVQEKESVVIDVNEAQSEDSLGLGPVELLYEQDETLVEFLGKGFLENAEVRAYVSGVSTYTPDGKPVISQHGNVISSAGCCGYGVSWAGGLGKLLAQAGCGLKAIPEELDAARFRDWDIERVRQGAVAFRHSKFQAPQTSA